MQDRSLTPARPERVFAAFSDPASQRRWFGGDDGFKMESFAMDFRAEGVEQSSFRSKDGLVCTNEPVDRDILSNRRIVFACTMALGGKRFPSSRAAAEFLATEPGSNLVLTEQGACFADADGPQIWQQGWRQRLEQLAQELAG